MTLEQVIAALEDPNVHSIVTDPGELKGWLKELKELRSLKTDYVFFKAEAKKLLKAAVEGFEYIKPYTSRCDGHCDNCPFENEGWCRIDWKYADAALKLIGGSENE